jgi:hypothetical protein
VGFAIFGSIHRIEYRCSHRGANTYGSEVAFLRTEKRKSPYSDLDAFNAFDR